MVFTEVLQTGKHHAIKLTIVAYQELGGALLD
jgi:hypothetical protein